MGPQPQPAGLQRGLDDALALESSFARKLDDQDRVLEARPISTTSPTWTKVLLSLP